MFPTTEQLNARNAAAGAPVTANGAYTSPNPSPASDVGIISTKQGVDAISKKTQTLSNLTTPMPLSSSLGTATDANPEKPTVTKAGEAPSTTSPTTVTLLNPDTGQSATFNDAGINKDNITNLMNNGYKVSEMNGTLPSWLVPATTGTANTDVAKAQAEKDQASADLKSLSNNLTKYTISDSALQSQIQGITSQWDARIADMERVNSARSANTNTLGIRLGSQFAGGSGGPFGGIVSEEERQGIARIGELEAQKQAAITAARSAAFSQNWSIYAKQVDLAQKYYDDKVQSVKDLQKATLDQNNYLLDVQKFNETKAQNQVANDQKATEIQQGADKILQGKYEFRDAKDEFGQTVGTVVYDKATGKPISTISSVPGHTMPGSNGPLNPVGLDSNGKVDLTAQKKYLGTLPASISALVTGLISYQSKPPSNTGSGKALNAYAHMADPTYDESQYLTRQKINNDYTSGATAKNIQSLNTAVNHLVDLSQNFSALPNTDINKWNTIKDWWDANVGKGNITKVVTDLNAVTGELAKVFKGTGATDEEIKNIKGGISINSSPEQFKSFIEEATSLLGGRIDALNGNYEVAMGKSFPRNFINPDTMSKLESLKNQGYDIGINGVNYTDPTAYRKDPENDKVWNDTVSTLTKNHPGEKFAPSDVMKIINAAK